MLLVTGEQMRMIDAAMAERVGVTALALMEVAGAAVARAALAVARERAGVRDLGRLTVHAVAGKGHNGADALVAARHLRAIGHEAVIWIAAPEEELSELCRLQLGAALRTGARLATPDEDMGAADVVIDGILGTGQRLPLSDVARAHARRIREAGRPVVAVDLPTGVGSDTGEADGEAVQASVTVALGFVKAGLALEPGRSLAGRILLERLAMADELAIAAGCRTESFGSGEAARRLLARPIDGHKGTFGRVALLAGSAGMRGAASLAARGAYRAGAGLVHYLRAPGPDADVGMPPEVVLHALDAPPDTPAGWSGACADLSRYDAVICGPGLGRKFVLAAGQAPEFLEPLASVTTPVVLDADALNAIAANFEGVQWCRRRAAPTILTPHPLEMARLLGVEAATVQADRLSSARRGAERSGAVVVLKGAATVVATPDGHATVNQTGNTGLATGGSGDVLAGVIGGLLAGGYAPEAAARLGVYLHGLAADIACASGEDHAISEESLMASDVAEMLGAAFRRVWQFAGGLPSDRVMEVDGDMALSHHRLRGQNMAAPIFGTGTFDKFPGQ